MSMSVITRDNIQELSEEQLLLSDDEEKDESKQYLPQAILCSDKIDNSVDKPFYEDTKADQLNTKVTTLYYPGRPHYKKYESKLNAKSRPNKPPRYFECAALRDELPSVDDDEEFEGAEGVAALFRQSAREGRWGRALWFSPNDAEARLALKRASRLSRTQHVRVLYHYGCLLRAAGLFEQLLTLIDLIFELNFGAERSQYSQNQNDENDLLDYEDKCTSSGLPSSVVWYRVERARAAHHWRPLPGGAKEADPQRSVDASACVDLLQPLVETQLLFALSVFALRWAGVPLLVGAEEQSALSVLHGDEREMASRWEHSGAEALLAPMLVDAERVEAAAWRGLFATLAEPPHCDSSRGFDEYVESLWAKAIRGFVEPQPQLALRLWRLRWLRSRATLSADASAVRRSAKVTLGEHPCALLAAEFALLPPQKSHSLWLALRASISDKQTPVAHSLRIARMIYWHCGALSGSWAMAYAVCRLRPPDKAPDTQVCRQLMGNARVICEERCTEIERDGINEKKKYEDAPWLSMVPAEEAEWASARVILAESEAQLIALADRVIAMADDRYAEAMCETIATKTHPFVGRRLLTKFPLNVRLSAFATRRLLRVSNHAAPPPPPLPPSPPCALASLLPLLLLLPSSAPENCRRLCAAIERSAGARLAPLLAVAHLEAAARCRALSQAKLLQAVQRSPRHRAVYVRATQLASAVGLQWTHLLDAMLDCDVRLHALVDELAPIATDDV